VAFMDEFEELISWLDRETSVSQVQKRMIPIRVSRKVLN